MDRYFFQEAWKYAKENSDDAGTKHGVVIVRDDKIIAYGANALPKNLEKTEEILAKPEFYSWVRHAEGNALDNVDKDLLSGATMYSPWMPCSDCAREIVDSGIEEVVFHKETNDFANQNPGSRDWLQNDSLEMFDRENISYRSFSGKIFDEDFYLKFRNKDFSP